MSKEHESEESAGQPSIKIPRYSPSKPPKNYNKNKSISIFCCLEFSAGFRCPEILRGTITKGGDIYVIPEVEFALGDFHISYHKSGKFHWTQDRIHTEPVFGKADFAAAFSKWLKLKRPPCFCLRKGKNLNEEEVYSLIQCLAENLFFSFDIKEASNNLKDTRFYRLIQSEYRQIESY